MKTAQSTFLSRRFSGLLWLLALAVIAAGTSGNLLAQSPWQSVEVGATAVAGGSGESGGVATVRGSGEDIWGSADEFHFRYQTLSGDGRITARITSMTDTNGWAKAGVMIRESLAPGASNVFLAATPTWQGIHAQQRSSPGGPTGSTAGPAAKVPYWLRLVRAGSAITASTSPDGVSWTDVRAFNATMSAPVYIGLAVSSHNDGTLCTAAFDNVALVSTAPDSGLPGAPTNLTATPLSASQIRLAWTNTSATQTSISIERSTTGTGFAQIATVTDGSSSYTDSSVNASITYNYQVRGISSAGPGAASNTASATPAPPASGTWQSIDIGTNTAGRTSASADTVMLTGSGRDIWNEADGFRYYYQPMADEEREMIVRVASLQNTNGWAKAGIMLRESLDPGSPHAWVCVSVAHGTAFQYRQTASGETLSTAPSEDGTAPRWLKLVLKRERDGSGEPRRVDGYVSRDGVTWTLAGGQYLPNTWRHIGLAVTSHNDGALSTAQFDSFRLLTPPPAATNFRVTRRGPNDEIELAWDYSVTDVDSFVIRTNPQRAGNHEWTVATTVPGNARQAVIRISRIDGVEVEICAFRDFVRSAPARIVARPTVPPSMSVRGATSDSIAVRLSESFSMYGPYGGPWALERSSDGVSYVEITRGLSATDGGQSTVWADYTDSGLPAGITRYYRARLLLANGDTSGYSNVVSATTTLSGSSPAAPTNLGNNGGIASTQLVLTWSDNATNETSYQIERSNDGTTFSLLATLAANAREYTDNAVTASTLYYYRVRAFTAAAPSGYSNIASARTTATSPAAPTGLSATPISAGQIQLTWTDNTTNEYTFEIQRSSDGVNFDTRLPGTGPNITSMMDTTVSPSTAYYYRVRALVPPGSALSNIAKATTPPPPSGSWQSGDVGAVAMTGNDSTSGTMVTVSGGGSDIWHSADSFRFRHQTLTGDGSITARVASMTNTDGWAKAGVMIRSSVSAGARNVFAALTPSWHGITAQARSADEGATASMAGPAATPPYWLRLTRAGTTFTAQASPDGTTWTTYATFSVTMDSSVLVGLAVTSHNQSALCTATFDNVAISGGTAPVPTGSWSAADIGAVGIAGSHTASGSTITTKGSGADIWGTTDALHFVWQTRTGDGVVEAQVTSMGNTNGWAKAGVMIRESASPSAPNVFVALTPSWQGIVAQARSATGGDTALTTGPMANAPYWIRLARAGNIFTASTSATGTTWTSFATFNVAMSATANFGFAVTSHDNTQLNQAVFADPFVGVR